MNLSGIKRAEREWLSEICLLRSRVYGSSLTFSKMRVLDSHSSSTGSHTHPAKLYRDMEGYSNEYENRDVKRQLSRI